jgi:hypothetical protein
MRSGYLLECSRFAQVSGHPVAGVDYPQTFQQLREWFPDEVSCLEYLGKSTALKQIPRTSVLPRFLSVSGESRSNVDHARKARIPGLWSVS